MLNASIRWRIVLQEHLPVGGAGGDMCVSGNGRLVMKFDGTGVFAESLSRAGLTLPQMLGTRVCPSLMLAAAETQAVGQDVADNYGSKGIRLYQKAQSPKKRE